MKAKVHPIVVASYIVFAVSVVGMFSYPNISPYFWIILGLIGGTLLVIKNRYTSDKRNLTKILLFDVVAVSIIITVAILLPLSLGLVKQLIIASASGIYMYITCNKYFAIANK